VEEAAAVARPSAVEEAAAVARPSVVEEAVVAKVVAKV